MAIPVARVHLAMDHAALPALLPTPPKWKMMPLLPTPPCVVILPMSPPKPSRADADERWGARKNETKSPSKPCRADAVERWDAHKTVKPASPTSSGSGQVQRTPDGKSTGSPGRASSCERWNSNKKKTTSSSSSSSASRPSSGDKWDSNKRRPVSRASSSAERWDAHKKPRAPQADAIDDDGQSSTGSNDMELDMPQRAFYAGPGFIASPEPSMLPMPSSFMVRVAA